MATTFSTPRSNAKNNDTHTNIDDALVGKDGLPLYGMDVEAAKKEAAKMADGGDKLMHDASCWISAVLDTKLEGTLQESLKSGVVLCQLANAIRPGCCAKPSAMSAPFKQMENIGNYVAACESLGVRKDDSFQTVALYENKDMLAVLRQINQLGAVAQKIGFDGPTLGAKLADHSKREFSAEQLAKGAAGLGLMARGSVGLARNDGIDRSKDIVKPGENTALRTAEMSLIGKGSVGLARNDGIDKSKDIVKPGEAPMQTAELSLMGTGSHGHASLQVGADGLARNDGIDKSKDIVKPGEAPVASAELSLMGTGSTGHTAAVVGADGLARNDGIDRSKDIVKPGAAPLQTAELSLMGPGSHGHASLQVGADGLASQQGMFDTTKNIVKAGEAPAASADLTMMAQGSTGCASQAGMADHCRHEIVRGAQA
jgi:hypothetical protein